MVVGDVKKHNSRTNPPSASTNGKKPKVSFNFDELSPHRSPYDQRKRPLHAKVTMAGLSLTGPIKGGKGRI